MKTPPILCRKETDEYTKADDNTRGRTEPQIRNRYGNGGSHCKKENRQTVVTVWRHTEFLMPEASTQSPPVILTSPQLLYHMSDIFQDNSLPRSHPNGTRIDRKRWEHIIRKQLASGQTLDDHPDPKMDQVNLFM